jgi:hypothetical protein
MATLTWLTFFPAKRIRQRSLITDQHFVPPSTPFEI